MLLFDLAGADLLKYPRGYLERFVGLDLPTIISLASRDSRAQQASDEASKNGRQEVVESLTFEEFSIAAAHFPILGLGTTLLLEAMDPRRAMETRCFGDRCTIGKIRKALQAA